MAQYLMGMDYGTGGAKVTIIDDQAEVLSYAFREYKIFTNQPGWSEHDPVNYWVIACEMIKECIAKANIDPKDIKGFANSSALPSMVMVDDKHNPVNMAYNLMDRRATEEVKWLIDHIGAKRIFDINANRLEDHSNLVNLMWEKKHRPDDYKRIFKMLTIDGFIRLKLTGKATANFSSGAFFGVAYDIRKNEINRELLDEIGLSMDMMPEFFSCEEIVGHVTPKASEETGLPVGLPVAAGSVDCNAGWVGGGAVDVGDIHINLGTCGVMGVIHQDPDMMVDTMINCSYTTDSRNVFATVSATTTGGQTVRFLRDNFSQMEVAMEQLVPSMSAYDYLEREAGAVPPGSEGLIVLPYLMGERTPLWDSNAKGVIFGLTLNHTKKHLVRAMLESVAYALYDSYLIFKENISKINLPIVLNEGGAKNLLWRRIITDVFNEPTVFLKSRVGAPMGDAILAGVATGVFQDFSIAKQKAEYIEPLEPIQANHDMYMDYFDIYQNLYKHLKDDFTDLTRLRNKYLN
jgi:xylulokinase